MVSTCMYRTRQDADYMNYKYRRIRLTLFLHWIRERNSIIPWMTSHSDIYYTHFYHFCMKSPFVWIRKVFCTLKFSSHAIVVWRFFWQSKHVENRTITYELFVKWKITDGLQILFKLLQTLGLILQPTTNPINHTFTFTNI